MTNPEGLKPSFREIYINTSEKVPIDIGRKQLYREEFYSDEIKKGLTKTEVELLDELTNVTRRIADIYTIQKTKSFYPGDLTNTELTKAAEKTPDLLSPYTYVERNSKGDLITSPTHKIFEPEIREKGIVESLKKSA